jgi:hypothetical protein
MLCPSSLSIDKFMKRLFSVLFITLCCGALWAGNTFTPGSTWKDANGTFINAHGGQVIWSNGYYYWFGETRATSVSCYRSTDLYNWTHLTNALSSSGTATDADNDIASGRNIERPKVIYNKQTGKWVMWTHWENGTNYADAKVCVAQADKIEGPYTLKGVFRPNDHDSRDQTIFCDSDGRAYHYCSTDMNTNINVCLLSDDYLTPTTTNTKILNGQRYEAPAIFRVGDVYFGLFSGCSGWNPNQGRYAYSYDPMKSWIYGTAFQTSDGSHGIGFCVDQGMETTYKSQSTYVFQVHGKDKAYIYMGDRWNSGNVAGSTYVWLPLSMRSGYPAVRYYDSWDLSVFDEMYRYKRAKSIVDGGEYMFLEKRSNRIVSRPSTSFVIGDDDEQANVHFTFVTTDDPYIYKIKELSSGNCLESVYGTMRLNPSADKASQLWRFVLEADGYYRIENVADHLCLSLSGGSTIAGSSIFLNEKDSSIPQSFAVYYDSKTHPDYEEADIFSTAYRDNNLKLMEKQAATSVTSTSSDASPRVVLQGRTLSVTMPRGTEARLALTSASGGATLLSGHTTAGACLLTLPDSIRGGVYLLSITTPLSTQVKKLAIL